MVARSIAFQRKYILVPTEAKLYSAYRNYRKLKYQILRQLYSLPRQGNTTFATFRYIFFKFTARKICQPYIRVPSS